MLAGLFVLQALLVMCVKAFWMVGALVPPYGREEPCTASDGKFQHRKLVLRAFPQSNVSTVNLSMDANGTE